MLKFLIDEDIPRSTAKVLRNRGYKVLDIRDCALRGEADEEVFKFAQKEKAVILTGDLGFGTSYTFLLADIQGLLLLISLMKYPLQS